MIDVFSRSLCTSRQLYCILNDWCCYPAIFKHYHWERTFHKRVSMPLDTMSDVSSMCTFNFLDNYMRKTHQQGDKFPHLLLLYITCVSSLLFGRWRVCVNREWQILSLALARWWCYLMYRSNVSSIKSNLWKGMMMQNEGQLLLGCCA